MDNESKKIIAKKFIKGFFLYLCVPYITVFWLWYKKKWTAGKRIAFTVWAIVALLIGLSSHSAPATNTTTAPIASATKTAKTTVSLGKSVQLSKQRTFSKLEITNVTVNGKKITIKGITDLPNDSVVNIDFDIQQKPTDTYLGVNEDVKVKNKSFLATLDIPQREEFKKGPYEITVLFTPRNEPANITKLVGENGENLTGKLVDSSDTSFKTLQLIKDFTNLNLSVSVPTPNTPTVAWNTSDTNVETNGNIPLAVQTIQGNPNLKPNAVSPDSGTVFKRPWDYYGKSIKLTGTVALVQDYPPNSATSQAFGGTAAELAFITDDGTYVDFVMMGTSGDTKVGDRVSVYGYTVGLVDAANKLGGRTTELAVVGNLIEK